MILSFQIQVNRLCSETVKQSNLLKLTQNLPEHHLYMWKFKDLTFGRHYDLAVYFPIYKQKLQ